MQDKMLGVLGGMGPLASAHFMTRLTLLTPAGRDQDHIPAVLWSDPRVPNRTRGRQEGAGDPLPWLRRGVRGLKGAGCGAIVIPCNTAHGWYDDLVVEGLPILHIVDAVAEALRRAALRGAVGLLATSHTLHLRLYQERLERLGWHCLMPTEAEMADAVAPAIALVKANRVADAVAPLAATVRALAGRGAGSVVLGCTEIALALPPADQPSPGSPVPGTPVLGTPVLGTPGPGSPVPGVAVIDSIDALAVAAIGWARG